MWPFKKKIAKNPEQKDLKSIETPYSGDIKKLNSWINIGDKFQYMGVEFVLIKKFQSSIMPIGFIGVISYEYPDVVGEYVDANGVFRQKKFNLNQIDSIINQEDQ